jgi:thiol-disulfide isomerase/thioredoxin
MKFQKKSIITITAILAAAISLFAIYDKLNATKDNTEIKSLLANLKQLDGTEPHFTLSQSPNKNYVILHYWASWCGPCQEEMPTIVSTYAKIDDKFRIILISEDENQSEGLSFLKKVGVPINSDFTWWDADKRISAAAGVFKLPETFIYDSNFNLIRKIAGPMNWNDRKNLQYLKSL